jgi:acyl-CoA dehydrogenase
MEPIFATEKLRKILPTIAHFVKTELLPLEAEMHTRPLEETERILNLKREKVKALKLWTPHLAVEDGGLGLTLCEFGQVSEALSKASFLGHYTFNCQAPDIGNTELLHKFASPEIKHQFLEPLIQGKIRSCFAMTEPEFAGSNPTKMNTTAVREGNEYVINGRKWFTTAAQGAGFTIVMAVTNPDARPHERASMILVPTDNPGFKIERNIPIFGEKGYGWWSHAEVTFTDCRVPISNLIHAEGSGFKLAQERLGPGRIHHCMRWIGISEKALDLMCQRAATREIAEGVMLGEKQLIQSWIAEARVEIDAARMMVLRTAHNIDQEGASAMRDQISGIKFFVSNIMLKVLDRAIQTHGADGITDDNILSHLYRHERAARIYDGADEVHIQNLALSILKGYGLDLKKNKNKIL